MSRSPASEIPSTSPITLLARHVAMQRGVRRMKQQTLDQYQSAVIDRMRVIRNELDREITGADVFATINSPTVVSDPVAWEDTPTWEQELYTEAVRVFSEQQADPLLNNGRTTMDTSPQHNALTLQDIKTLAVQLGVQFRGSPDEPVFDLDSTNGYIFAGTFENSQAGIEVAYGDLVRFGQTLEQVRHHMEKKLGGSQNDSHAES